MLRRPSTAKLVTIIAVLAVVAGGAVAVASRWILVGTSMSPKSPTPIGQSSLARSQITSCVRCKN